MQVLSDIAGAMHYLHSRDIILRDVKAENCGFDAHGSVKLFDFGLAATLRDGNRVGHDQYKFSVEGGTLRYMAPGECASLSVFGGASGLTIERLSHSYSYLAILTLQIKPLP